MLNLDEAINLLQRARKDYHARWNGSMKEKNLNHISYFHAIGEASEQSSVDRKELSDEFLRRNPGGVSKGITDDGEELGRSGDQIPTPQTRSIETGRDQIGSKEVSDVPDRGDKGHP